MKWIENGASSVDFCCSKEKPNIFLIGDSIRKGYCETVKKQLSDCAEVFYFDDNCRSTQYIIFNLKKWAGMFDDSSAVDIVQFNCGQWDVAHWNGHKLPLTSESEYERNLQIIIDQLKYFFPRAELVFATTSPMNPDGSNGFNPRNNEAVDKYNAIAKDVMNRNGICINDINEFMRPWGSDYYSDSCHLTGVGFETLGKYVAEQLKKHINIK